MFIISKKNFKVRRADGSPYFIQKEFIGEIPDDVAKNELIQSAIQSGSIATPTGHKDKELQQADELAASLSDETDIRPDAVPGKNIRKK